MGNFCHCTQLPGYDATCSSCHSRHHCLQYPVILHHTLHLLPHAGCHRKIPPVQRSNALIWPEVLCELIANCMVKTATGRICSFVTFIIQNFFCPGQQYLWNHANSFVTQAEFFLLQTLRQTYATRNKNICSGMNLSHIFLECFLAILHTSLTLMFVHYRYKSITAQLITLQVSQCIRVINYFPLDFIKYTPHQKIIGRKLQILMRSIFYTIH
jgi:hypothetical protein